MAKIAVLTTYFGGIDSDHLHCMSTLEHLAREVKNEHEMWFLRLHNWPWIDIAQSLLVDRAIAETEADILFWIEHDMLFNARDVIKVSERCLSSEYDMLGAAYSQRTPGGRVVGGLKEKVTFFQPGLYPADSCGFGFTASKRSLFLRMRETLPEVDCPPIGKNTWPYFAHMTVPMYCGQDTSFCKRVTEAGMKIGIDAEVRVGHKGSYVYHLEDTGITVPRYEGGLTINPKD